MLFRIMPLVLSAGFLILSSSAFAKKSCYAKNYSADFLARNPQQQVTAMYFLSVNSGDELGGFLAVNTRSTNQLVTDGLKCNYTSSGIACSSDEDDNNEGFDVDGKNKVGVVVDIAEGSHMKFYKNGMRDGESGKAPSLRLRGSSSINYSLSPVSVSSCNSFMGLVD